MGKKHRMNYETPRIDCIRVEAESDFMSGSVMEHPDSRVEIKGHEIGGDYDFEKQSEGTFNVEWE